MLTIYLSCQAFEYRSLSRDFGSNGTIRMKGFSVIDRPELEWKPWDAWDDPLGYDSKPSYFFEQPLPRDKI